jgi:hypothetical protein
MLRLIENIIKRYIIEKDIDVAELQEVVVHYHSPSPAVLSRYSFKE